MKKIYHGAPLNPILNFFKEYGITVTLLRGSHTQKVSGDIIRALVRETTKWPMSTLCYHHHASQYSVNKFLGLCLLYALC